VVLATWYTEVEDFSEPESDSGSEHACRVLFDLQHRPSPERAVSMTEWRHHGLLVVDVQNDFLKDVPDPHSYRQSLEWLLAYCRGSGMAVYHLRVYREPDRSNWMPFEILRGRAPCLRETAGVETPEWASALPDEPVIRKDTFDGFLRTDLDERLRGRGIRHLFVAGLVTSVCVLITAMAAMQRGFLVTVVRDCVADEEPDHSETLRRYGGFAFDVVSSRDVPGMHRVLETRIGEMK
jgi:nicotinamidase-related amidase